MKIPGKYFRGFFYSFLCLYELPVIQKNRYRFIILPPMLAVVPENLNA
jgi:hypothetical protein